MERNAIIAAILRIFAERFEMNPGLDDNLRDAYEFDSIDAVELLHDIEVFLGTNPGKRGCVADCLFPRPLNEGQLRGESLR